MSDDRQSGPLARLIRLIIGFFIVKSIDHLGEYRAKVISQSDDGKRVDVKPDDARVTAPSGIPLWLGIPGAIARVQPGCYVLLAWRAGDPAQPIAKLWEGGEGVIEIDMSATKIKLRGTPSTATQPGVLGNDLETRLSTLEGAYNNHKHGPGNTAATTGAVLGTVIVSPPNIKAANVEVS